MRKYKKFEFVYIKFPELEVDKVEHIAREDKPETLCGKYTGDPLVTSSEYRSDSDIINATDFPGVCLDCIESAKIIIGIS